MQAWSPSHGFVALNKMDIPEAASREPVLLEAFARTGLQAASGLGRWPAPV